MHLLRLLPDWNSLESVRHAHAALEAAALIFFALLVAFETLSHMSEDSKKRRICDVIGLWCFAIAVLAEIAAYPYGQRNDDLSGRVIRSLSETANQAAVSARNALKDSGNAMTQAVTAGGSAEQAATTAKGAQLAANNALGNAQKAQRSASSALVIAGAARAEVATVKSNIAKVDEKYAPRKLSKTKRDMLIDILRKAKIKAKEPVEVTVAVDAPDGAGYANEIAAAINDPATGWKAKHERISSSYGLHKGVYVMFHDLASAPPWVMEMQRALSSAGIGGAGLPNSFTPVGTAVIFVERKNDTSYRRFRDSLSTLR